MVSLSGKESASDSSLELPHVPFSSWVGRKHRCPLLGTRSGASLGGMGKSYGLANGRRRGSPP